MAKSFVEIERLVERYDEAQRNLDEAVADRIAMALDVAYRNLERELRALYPQWESQGSLYAVQRRLLLMDALGDALNIIRPEQQAEYEKLFTEALNISHMNGGTLAGELIRAREPGYPLQEFTAIPVEAAVAQARDGVKRLYRHSEDFRNAASGIVEQGLIQGWGTGKVAKALRDQVGATKSKAETIARTEMSSAFNTAAKQRYQENGIELVQWFTTSSDRLCAYCLSREGKVYRIEDVIIPAHPRCRCLSVPYSEKWQRRGWTDDEAVTEIHQQRLAEMAALGTTPTDRPTPWERQRGMTSAPKPVWSPGNP